MNKKRILIILTILLVLSFSVILYNYYSDNRKYKDYIIENIDCVYKTDINGKYYKMDLHNKYYTDISIEIYPDSSYRVIYWGDRDSWMWDYRTDHYFHVDIPYKRYKNKDVDKDVKLYRLISELK
jgi:hypothetical protein